MLFLIRPTASSCPPSRSQESDKDRDSGLQLGPGWRVLSEGSAWLSSSHLRNSSQAFGLPFLPKSVGSQVATLIS